MRKFKYELAVGFVFLVAMGILGYYTIIMSKKILEPKKYTVMTVIFPTVEGLKTTDKVKINGVLSGSVMKIKLKGHKVWVKLKIYNEFTLYENYDIRIKTEAALGGKHVAITPGTPTDDSGRKTYKIVLDRQDLPGHVDDPIASITRLIEENRPNIYAAIKNIREISEKINKGKGTIGQLINQDKVHTQAGDLVKEIREAIEDTREQAPVNSFIRAALTAF